MNKNPFVPQPSYTPQQPPLPPGPPPPQPTHPDYSAYWAAAQGPHQQPQPQVVNQYNPQWNVPQSQPPTRPPAEQSALYANYGYSAQWQRQQQQQQLQQMQAQQYHHPPPPPVAQPPSQPAAQPAYNPYQPTAGYPQPYVPQAIPSGPHSMAQSAYPHPHPPTQQPQQQFFQQLHIPPQAPQQQQQHRHQIHHTPPQHLPPAKRQRFDGPNNRHTQSQHHVAPPPQPQFQAPPPPPQNIGPYAAHGRGGPPGMSHMQMGGGRGGIPGGRGGPSGGQRGGRGLQMSGSRGGMAGGRGRGGGSGFSGPGNTGSGGRGGGGGSSGSLRAHGSRGNFGNKDYQHRRGGGSGGGGYSHQGGSFRGRGGHTGSNNRTSRHDGGSNFGSRDGQASSSFGSAGKKDENRRTLTDFKIVGLEIRDLSWTWGVLPQVITKPMQEEFDGEGENLEATVKDELMDEDVETKTENAAENPIQTDPSADQQPDALDTVGLDVVASNPEKPKTNTQESVSEPSVQEAAQPTVPQALPETGAYTPPPSRIRIYFHTPVTADDARPIPHNSSSFSFNATPSDSRKGKRKKSEDDDGELEEERTRPPPPQMTGINDDRSSVASVAPSAAETVSEADWLMAAIVEGEEDPEADVDPVGDDVGNDPEEDAEQWHVSQLVAAHDIEDVADGTQDVDAPATDGDHVDVNMVSADGGVAAPVAIEAGVMTQDGDAFAIDGTMPISVAPDNSLPVATAAPEPELDTVHLNGQLSVARDDESRSFIDDLPEETTLHVGSSPASGSGAGPSASALPDLSVSTFLPSPSSILSSVEKHSADDVGSPDKQDAISTDQVMGVLKSLLAVSAEPTLLDIDSAEHPTGQPSDQTGHDDENKDKREHVEDDESQTQPFEFDVATQEASQEIDRLPEPPVSPPSSNTLMSTPSMSTSGDSPNVPLAKAEVKNGRVPSANRLSISYAGGNRRLVIDAEVVESLKVYRQEGRIEVLMNIFQEGDDGLKGILVEGLSEVTRSYLPLQTPSENDPTLPPFFKVSIPSAITLRVYLDTARPLSEPKWAKSGDIQEWLKSMFGRMFWVAGEAAGGWEKKIYVVDPDPPPTIWTVLEGWAANSPAGVLTERQRFLKTHMTEIENILEILLRLVRGERATASYQSTPAISAPSLSGPLLLAMQGSAHSSQQTHVSLAVLAMFRMSVEYAQKADPDEGKVGVEERVGEIIRCLPSHLIYKSLDGIFKEWRVEKKGR